MSTKYKQYVELMYQNHKNDFDDFRPIHQKYSLDPDANQEELNEKGRKIQNIIRMWEDKLCGRSEGTGYGSFTSNLAEKFREEIKKDFPHIDSIGIKKSVFEIKRIKL